MAEHGAEPSSFAQQPTGGVGCPDDAAHARLSYLYWVGSARHSEQMVERFGRGVAEAARRGQAVE